MRNKTYSELLTFSTFEDRFNYLILRGKVGKSTFGDDRYLNQNFYRSGDWRRLRNSIIVRDNACDLALPGFEIYSTIYVHHMNPISIDDIENNYVLLVNPEFLICTSFDTHQAITFGNGNNLFTLPRDRKKGDTKLW